nr:hypothetical protein [Myxococcota bacterium]
GGVARVDVLASDGDAGAPVGYAIAVLGDRELEVRRDGARALRRIAIPDDGARSARHRWELRFDPRPDEGGALELEVRRDGTLLAVLVDPEPLTRGERVVVLTRGGARVAALAIEAERSAGQQRPSSVVR